MYQKMKTYLELVFLFPPAQKRQMCSAVSKFWFCEEKKDLQSLEAHQLRCTADEDLYRQRSALSFLSG